jgi:hypothetical protein
MQKIFIIVLLVINGFITSAQNNAIFQGGTGDGVNKTDFVQAGNNIFTGGNGDGWNNISFTQATANIFTGGSGDGWNFISYSQVGNSIFNGGNGDGWNNTSFLQIGNNIFTGGIGDGWSSTYIPMGPIPVSFLYFNARKLSENTSQLNWKTAQEINSAYFNIERSTDALNFVFIGRVNAAGNSQVPVTYYFTDSNPENGLNYYRLKQTDLDGRFIYTPTRVVSFNDLNAGLIKYFPNPTNGVLNIELTEAMKKESKVINIVNGAGIVLNQFKLGNSLNTLLQVDLSKYPKGVYFVQVKTASINSTHRIVLQ